jgi:restriction system protein
LQLKMAKNSLFAILLRSPSWISFAISAALGLLSAALLPDPYKLVGALSAAGPFAVVGALALRRQWGLPNAAQREKAQQALSTMPWPAFSGLLEDAFRREGWSIEPGAQPPVDFVVLRNGRHMLVSAKRWKSARTGLESLRALQAAREAADASDALYISLGELTANARPFAAKNRIEIWQAGDLARVLRMPVPRG